MILYSYGYVDLWRSDEEDGEKDDKDDHNGKDFDHQPSIGTQPSKILCKFAVASLNVEMHLLNIHVNSLNLFALFGDHVCKLLVDGA